MSATLDRGTLDPLRDIRHRDARLAVALDAAFGEPVGESHARIVDRSVSSVVGKDAA